MPLWLTAGGSGFHVHVSGGGRTHARRHMEVREGEREREHGFQRTYGTVCIDT